MGKMFFFCHPTDGVRTLKGIQSTDHWLGLVLFFDRHWTLEGEGALLPLRQYWTWLIHLNGDLVYSINCEQPDDVAVVRCIQLVHKNWLVTLPFSSRR